MATRTTPFALTAAALASAATFATTTPDLIAARELGAGSAISPTRLSSASYELTAFADITVQGVNDAYWFGWGGYIQEDDPYYGEGFSYPPYPVLNVPIYVSGASGVLYYLIDNIVDQFTDQFDLDNYYFEVGWANGGFPNASFSGAGALLYVGAGELFGTDSPIFNAIDTIVHAGVTDWLQLQFTSLAISLVPKFDIGPVEVGGGILSALYFYGSTPDGSFQANNIGLPALWSYISFALTGLLPDGAVVADPDESPASAAAVESKVESFEHASSGVGGFRSAPAAASDESADLKAASVDAPLAKEGSAVESAPTAESAPVVESAPVEAPAIANVSALDAGAADQSAGAEVSAGPGIRATADSAPDVDSKTTATDVVSDEKAPLSGDKGPSKSAASSITGKVRAGLGGNSAGGKHRADGTGRSSAAAKAASANAA